MDSSAIKRLESIAASLHDFFELEEQERTWLLPMLSKNIQSTIKLLKIIEVESKTYDELSLEMGLHENTCRQKLLALKRGGFPILMDKSCAVLETGRKRVLSRRITEKEIVSMVEKK